MTKGKDKFDEIDSALKGLQETIAGLEGVDAADLARKVDHFREEIYAGISRWSSLELARHSDRPVFDDYLTRIFSGFTELHGDRLYGDDHAIVGGPARLNGERAQYVASRAQAKGKITETELQIIQVDKDMVSEVSKDLRETNDKIGELIERKVTAEDQLRRVEIRSPQAGVVHQLNVHTVGGVISPGEAVMLVVPVTLTTVAATPPIVTAV